MPVAYPMPQWLQGNSPEALGQLTLASIRAGQQVQMEKAQLAQRSHLAQMDMAMRADAAAKQHDEEMARLETAKAYQTIQATMRAKELETAEAALALRTRSAALAFQAQQRYQQAVDSGMDPSEAILRFGMGQAGFPEAAALKMASKTAPAVPRLDKVAGEDVLMYPGAGGTMHPYQIRHDKVKPPLTVGERIRSKQRERADMTNPNKTTFQETTNPSIFKDAQRLATFNEWKSKLAAIDREIKRLYESAPEELANEATDEGDGDGTETPAPSKARYVYEGGKLVLKK